MANPVRVALVLNRMDSGGIEAVVMNYCRHTDPDKVQFDFYISRESNLPQKEELERMGAGIHLIPPYTKVLEYQRVLKEAFEKEKYPIVHAHLNTMSIFPLFAAWRACVPVRICHNHTTAHWGEGKKTILKYMLRPFNKVFATDYFACSKQAGEWMFGKKCFRDGKVKVMINAIDEERFSYDPQARKTLREEWGIPQDKLVIGHVGRFTYQKNQEFLLKVLKELKNRKTDVLLLLVGEGNMEQEIRNKAKEMGLEDQVLFAGVRMDVNKLYSAMDLFCLPSFYEGFGLVALEAQAAGLPCVCSVQVPQEALGTREACRIPIEGEEAPCRWADQLMEYAASARNSGAKLKPEYSIVPAAKKMEDWYREAAKR